VDLGEVVYYPSGSALKKDKDSGDYYLEDDPEVVIKEYEIKNSLFYC